MRRVALLPLFLVLGLLPVAAPAGAADKYPVPYNFLTDAVVAGTKVDEDPPGANDWTCRPTRKHPRPVVLVHGTFGNKSTNWQTYAPLLANNGYCVFALTYGVKPGTPKGQDQFGGMDDMRVSARQLAAFVTKVLKTTGAREVDVVGHSQGTLVPNWYVKFLGGARRVHSYVSLAPLWHGTQVGGGEVMVQAMQAFGVKRSQAPVCTACTQFQPSSEFMKKMRRGGVKVRGVTYTNIVTRYDELVVPYTSGIERGMRNIVVQDRCESDYAEHFEIAADPVAAGHVLNALDRAHRRPVPCTTVLPFEGPLPVT